MAMVKTCCTRRQRGNILCNRAMGKRCCRRPVDPPPPHPPDPPPSTAPALPHLKRRSRRCYKACASSYAATEPSIERDATSTERAASPVEASLHVNEGPAPQRCQVWVVKQLHSLTSLCTEGKSATSQQQKQQQKPVLSAPQKAGAVVALQTQPLKAQLLAYWYDRLSPLCAILQALAADFEQPRPAKR